MYSEYWQPTPPSCCQMRRWQVQGIWMRSTSSEDCHRPGRPPPCLLVTPPPPAPLALISMYRWLQYSASQVTNISYFGQHGRGWFPSSRTTLVSRTWHCKKWIRRAPQITALPGNPLTEHAMLHADQGKEILYIRGSVGGGGDTSLVPTYHPMLNLVMGHQGTLPPDPHRSQGRGTAGGVSPGVLDPLP